MTYDPEHAPDAAGWLELGESERIRLIAAYHQAAGATPPNAQVHAAMHSVVENQLAEEMTTVRETVTRLCDEGLSRHEAVHAVGWVLVSHLSKLMRPGKSGEFAVEDYFRELRSLTAAGCRKQGGVI